MKVIAVSKKEITPFILKKHYSKRMPIFWEGFALIENDIITGAIIYGQPSAPIQKYAFENRDFRLYELSRLVIQSKNKNAASFLISHSLRMLKDIPCAVISYADSEYNHCGIVYQATNWIYTGETISHDHLYIIDGKRVHPASLSDKGITSPKKWAKENNIQTVKPSPKHRYFYFLGTKREKKIMINKLKYSIIKEYPKCDQNRYDDGDFLYVNISENINSLFGT